MKSVLKIFLASMLVSCLFACVTSSNLQEGISSFKAQDYRQAFIRLKPEALKGHVEAEYAIGYMYYYGQGVVEDRHKAMHWISLAAKSGYGEAIEALNIIKRCN